MRALVTLSRANLKSFVRDRAALFWTLAFPILFVVLFGTIFSGGGKLTWNRFTGPGRLAIQTLFIAPLETGVGGKTEAAATGGVAGALIRGIGG